MITRHVKINQLDINKLNTHSNNDILLNEISFSIHFENEKFSLRSIPQFTDFLEGEYLEEQVTAINELTKYASQLERIGNNGHGIWNFDKEFSS